MLGANCVLGDALGRNDVAAALEQRVAQARDRQKLQHKLASTTDQWKAANEARRVADEVRHRVFARRVASISAELAAKLEPLQNALQRIYDCCAVVNRTH